jgi:broad specificity phosphatase PhoE
MPSVSSTLRNSYGSESVKFILIRHGEATHNVGAETEGDAAYENPAYRNSHLTAKGVQQTTDAGKKIASTITTDAAALWCSPLQRCLQTAENVMKSVNVPLDQMYLHDSLLERLGRGHVCNTRAPTSEIRRDWPDFNANMLPDVGPEWKGIEGRQSVKLRMTMLVEHLKRVYAGAKDPVIIVSHHDALLDLIGYSFKNAEFMVTDLS